MKKYSFLSNTTVAGLVFRKLTLLTAAVFLTAFQASAQTGDTNSPEIVDFNFATTVVDTTNQAQNVVLNVRATDNDSGVNSIVVRFRSVSSDQFVNAFIAGGQRVSGDGKNGVYSAALVFPQYCKAGTWRLLEIEVRDAANNYKTLGTAEVAALGFATELQVISNNEDLNAPETSDLRFDKSSVDTTNESQTVTFTVRVTDAFSGARNVDLYFSQPSNDYLIPADANSLRLVSGDSSDGVYTGTITFLQGTDPGVWSASVSVSDRIGNRKTFGASELAARGSANEIQVSGAAQQPSEKSRKRARLL